MKLKDWLLPREEQFFDLFVSQAQCVVEGAEALHRMVKSSDGTGEHRRAVKEVEHRADEKTHLIFTALNESFITPMDREDIAALAQALDDIIDFTWATANHLHLYGITQAPPAVVEVAQMLVDQTKLVQEAVSHLKDLRTTAKFNEILTNIHRLENKADEACDEAVLALFQLEDVRTILKLKDVYRSLETATDKCEDVADVIRGILIKHS